MFHFPLHSLPITHYPLLCMFSHLDLLFSSTPLEGPEQMALDEVLLGVVQRPLLRVYCWKSPCVTFGYFQKQNLVKKLYPNSSLVRRWSGGGCVEHGEDFTFSLMIPGSEPVAKQAPSLFYRMLHQSIVMALQEHQIEARLAAPEDQVIGDSCFVAPCPCDVMLDRKKIVGGAQRRSAGRLLHQGSLHLGDGRFEMKGEKWKQFFISLAKQLAAAVALMEEKSAWLTDANDLALERYRSQEWLEKR
jgi:lipoate-protein ligase A